MVIKTMILIKESIFISKYYARYSARSSRCIVSFHACLKCSFRHDSKNNAILSLHGLVEVPFGDQ